MKLGRGKKIAFITGGVIMLVAGVFVGAFLVLQSMQAEGQLAPVEEDTTLNSQITEPLLDELDALRSGEQTLSGAEEDNLTQQFLETIAREAEQENISFEEEAALSSEPLQNTVASFLQNNRDAIIPTIPKEKVKRSVKATEQSYKEAVSPHVLVLSGAWQKILQVSKRGINTKTRTDLQEVTSLLDKNHKELLAQEVPLSLAETHRDILAFSLALKNVIHFGILQEGNDPMRGILAVLLIEDVRRFGASTLETLTQ